MRFPKDGELVKSLMIGEARFMMTPIKEFTTELSAMLADPKRLGKRHLMLTWKMSPKWNEFTSECDKWIAKMLSR
jgi:hypothetical protein